MQRTDKMTVPTWDNSRANKGTDYKSYIVRGAEIEGWNIPTGTGGGLKLIYEILSTPLKADQVYVNNFALDGGSLVSPLPSQFGVWTTDSEFQTVEWIKSSKMQKQTNWILRPALDVLASQGTDRDSFVLFHFSKLLDSLQGFARNEAIKQIINKLSNFYFWVPVGTVLTSFADSQKNDSPGLGTGLTQETIPTDKTSSNIIPLLVSGFGLLTGSKIAIFAGLALRIFGSKK